MAAKEVIDLSLSTDDESEPKNSAAVRTTQKKVVSTLLSDDFELDFSPDHTRLSKRRRLSPRGNASRSSPRLSALASAQNDNNLPAPAANKPATKSKSMIDSDPIQFTSSPIFTTRAAAPVLSKATTTLLPFRSSSPIGGYSEDDILSTPVVAGDSGKPTDFDDTTLLPTTTKRTMAAKPQTGISMTTSPIRKKPTSSTADKERLKAERAEARAATAEAKRLLKEENATLKKLEREAKAREKQHASDIAEANKSRLDRKVSTREMIVDLPTSIAGKSVDTNVRQQLENLDVEFTTYTSLLPNVIKWRRKVSVRWDDEAGYWLPLRPTIVEEEPHVLVLVSAQEFVAMADQGASEDETLDAHVRALKNKFVGAKILYLIEGLDAGIRKIKNAKNREYQAAVRAQGQAGQAAAKSKAKRKETVVVDESAVEEALMKLQIVHDCLVYHTVSNSESAQWIVHFTQHISTIPYRTVRNNVSTTFCMDVGQVRTGEDAADTYVKMLQQVVRVTAPIAYGIVAEYPDVVSLVKGYERKGNLMLEDLKKSSNRDGGFSDARIGPAISRRLEKVFLGMDPTSMDI